MQIYLIDGYLDEPSCLGVPPYISPHIRYIWGAAKAAGIREEDLNYITIDTFRNNREKYLEKMETAATVILIAGTTVPGNYLGGQPASLAEIKELGKKLKHPKKVLGGPVTLVKNRVEGYDHICGEMAARDIYRLLTGKKTIPPQEIEKYISRWAVWGASVTRHHPDHPHLVCEIETFRGCPRSGHCHFCSEQLKQIHYHRRPQAIIREVKALAKTGNHHFRLGCQTDLLTYNHRRLSGEIIPNPRALEKLYRGIRKADPDLRVLHMDNINPATIVRRETESRRALKIITTYNTTGDTAAFGLESADPQVIRANNIAAGPETALRAIEILNEIGGFRRQGIPVLLPGINFLHGLWGETKETMDYNYRFLKKVLDRGLLLRRINIRQVIPLAGFEAVSIDKQQFKEYKKKVNEEINRPLLEKVFPTGTIIRQVRTETREGKTTFGRPLGTYPILIGIPGQLKPGQYLNVRVIDHGYRSLTALPWPLKINQATIEQLTAFPGIGKKRAHNIFLKQPQTMEELRQTLGKEFPFSRWQDWFQF
ncbi:MAG: radical SAM protein [Halanaerobiaceae bacterium]